VSDEAEQVRTVDGGIAETVPGFIPVRVQAAAADLHHRAGTALRRERFGADLPGHRRRMVEDVVEAA
jgi:hypothetical protein